MTPSRRDVIRIGGGLLAGLPFLRSAYAQDGIIEIAMQGNADGSAVWFEPIGLLIRPGQTVRWTNRDRGNSHTSTAYHPDNDGHPLRIPSAAASWNSDYLLPDQSFSVTLTEEGVYEYFCIPHEHAGMIGRIVVAAENSQAAFPEYTTSLPEAGARALPSIEEIVQKGTVSRTG